MKNIIHLSDIHILNNNIRNDEYKFVFNNLIELLKTFDDYIIVITGDIFNEKTILTVNAIILFKELIIELSKYAIIVMIDGNHDCNINNINIKSSIYATLINLNTVNKVYHLDKDNLSIKINNINFYVIINEIPIFDKKNNELYIGLYHGMLYKAKLDNNYIIDDNTKIKITDLEHFDICMLGDIHKHQFIKNNIAYSGSLLQMNYGESIDKHGFIKWDLNTLNGTFYEVQNEYCFLKCNLTVDNGFNILCRQELLNTKNYIHLEINYDEEMRSDVEIYVSKFKQKLLSIRYNENKKEKNNTNEIIIDKTLVDIYKELMKNNNHNINNNIINKLKEYSIVNIGNKQIKLIKLEFENLFSYGKKNIIQFDELNGLISIIGDNGTGKSSLIDVILFILFDKFSKGKGKEALNINKTNAYGNLTLTVNNELYRIERKITQNSSNVFLYKNNENISNVKKKDIDNDIIKLVGDYDLLNSICITLQEGQNLMNLSDFEKMKIFYNLLNIEKYDEIRKKSETNKISASRNMISIKRELDNFNIFINNNNNIETDINDNNSNIINIEKQLKKLLKQEIKFENSLSLLDSVKNLKLSNVEKELYNKKKLIDIDTIDINNKIIILENKLKELNIGNNYNERLNELIKFKYDIIVEDISDDEEEEFDIIEINQQIIKYNEEKIIIENNLLKFNNLINEDIQIVLNKLNFTSKCSKCSNNTHIINELEYENEDNILLKEKLNKKLLKINNNIKNIENNIIKFKEHEKLKEQKSKLKEKTQLLKLEKIKQIEELKNKNKIELDNIKLYKNIKQEYDELTQILNDSLDLTLSIELLEKNINDIQIYNELLNSFNENIKNKKMKEKELKECKINNDLYNKKIGEIELTNKLLIKKQEEFNNYQKEYNESIEVIQLYDKYKLMEYVLSKYIKKLEIIINNILMTIVNYKIMIEQDGSELKIFKVENDIKINTRQLSGNEKFIINIALKCAFNKISISYKSDFMIIDEGFGTCDNEKIEKIPYMFDIIKDEFKLCIVISHIDKIKNMNNKIIEIKKNNGISSINFK